MCFAHPLGSLNASLPPFAMLVKAIRNVLTNDHVCTQPQILLYSMVWGQTGGRTFKEPSAKGQYITWHLFFINLSLSWHLDQASSQKIDQNLQADICQIQSSLLDVLNGMWVQFLVKYNLSLLSV